MTEKVESPTRKISPFRLVILLATLILSVSALFLAVDIYIKNNDIVDAGYFTLMGFVGLSLSAYMLLQIKRKPLFARMEIGMKRPLALILGFFAMYLTFYFLIRISVFITRDEELYQTSLGAFFFCALVSSILLAIGLSMRSHA